MKTLEIKKKSGGVRIVVCPDPEVKASLRALVGPIMAKCRSEYAHGFRPMHSPVTNAQCHIGYRYTLSMDLSDFFDSVTPDRVRGRLSKDELAACMVDPGDGKPRACQGLPTSPAVSNIAAEPLDTAIAKLIEKKGRGVVYTRYADDLTFSFDDWSYYPLLLREIPQIASRCGFRINPKKTRLQDSAYGRREITGISVGESDIRVPRRIRRALRAAEWRAQHGETPGARRGAAKRAAGLAEWSKCRLPQPPKPKPNPADADAEEKLKREYATTASTLARHWDLPVPERIPLGVEIADGDYLITRDPAYVLGMSTYTTGWRSCMHQPDGQYRLGVGLWAGLAGTSVAALLSEREVSHAGISRRVMRARCLVHHFRDGSKAYDRCYGDPDSMDMLCDWLRTHGYTPVSRVPRGAKVKGNVLRSQCRKPYFDNLKAASMLSEGKRVWVVSR